MTAGQHVVVYWDEGAEVRNWYLGVIDDIDDQGNLSVSHFMKANRNDDTTWTYPERGDVQPVQREQILLAPVNVTYPLSVRRIRCVMAERDVQVVREKMKDMM